MTPGPELDAKIAIEVMGLRLADDDEQLSGILLPHGHIHGPGKRWASGNTCMYCTHPDCSWPRLPEFSTDIAAAWEVWERIQSLSLPPEGYAGGEPIPNAQPWIRFVQNLDRIDTGTLMPAQEMGNLWTLWCLTPERICLAALKAVGTKTP